MVKNQAMADALERFGNRHTQTVSVRNRQDFNTHTSHTHTCQQSQVPAGGSPVKQEQALENILKKIPDVNFYSPTSQ